MDDKYYINKTLELAVKGSGYVSPNPMVGAVIVKNGTVIGEGYHEKYGQNHAEVNAINNAKGSVEGSTMYINREPCSHFGKTPPCINAIINHGIKKVVVGDVDPNPEVNGKGIQILKQNGIEVNYGIEVDKCRKLNRFYYKYIKTGLPFVGLKIAQTLNGKISFKKNKRSDITCRTSLEKVHEIRSQYDAVVIGKNTAVIDNPMLNVRLVTGRSPKRYILDPYLEITSDLNVFSAELQENTFIVISDKCSRDEVAVFEGKNVNIVKLPESEHDRIDLKEFLKYLGEQKISSLLIEGGANVFTQFIKRGLVDYYYIFVAPKFSSKGENVVSDNYDLKKEMKIISVEHSGDDIIIEGET